MNPENTGSLHGVEHLIISREPDFRAALIVAPFDNMSARRVR